MLQLQEVRIITKCCECDYIMYGECDEADCRLLPSPNSINPETIDKRCPLKVSPIDGVKVCKL